MILKEKYNKYGNAYHFKVISFDKNISNIDELLLVINEQIVNAFPLQTKRLFLEKSIFGSLRWVNNSNKKWGVNYTNEEIEILITGHCTGEELILQGKTNSSCFLPNFK